MAQEEFYIFVKENCGPVTRVVDNLSGLVRVIVIPEPGTVVWGVEDYIPAGMEAVGAIGGENPKVHPDGHKVTFWGEGDATVEVRYTLTGTADAPGFPGGAASFDGKPEIATVGHQQIIQR